MSKIKISDLTKAEKTIKSFEEGFDAVITITNSKGKWIMRCTRRNVQIFMKTGDSMLDCILKGSEVIEQKKKDLGV